MTHDFNLSFEFFPPRTVEAGFSLWNTLEKLAGFDPDFVSITYGADGSVRDLTCDVLGAVHTHYGVPVAGHLTCVGATQDEVLSVARAYVAKGARRIVALRGDAPKAGAPFQSCQDGFASSLDLIAALAKLNLPEITAAAYPNLHPEARSEHDDLDHLKAKFDAGATSAITQFFFEAEDFLRFRDRAVSAGITQPIIPGILPIENWRKVKAFAKRCAVPTPWWLDQGFAHVQAPSQARLFSTAICTELCSDLLSEGVSDLHFYTLNDGTLTADICRALGRTLRHPHMQATG